MFVNIDLSNVLFLRDSVILYVDVKENINSYNIFIVGNRKFN